MTIKGKATSLDIAHLAGVSQPTVSRALRGSPMVNAETRERILRIARELNYKVDKNASSLRLRNAGTLALLFFEDPTNDDSLINPFFHSMLGSITRACALHGQDLLVSFQQLSTDWQADYEDSNKADGIILLGYGDYHESRDRLQRLVEQGTHFVRWGAALPGQPGVSIGSDNFQGGHDITTHLLQQGCRRIAFLGHASSHYPEFQERYRGHVAALQEHGLAAEPALQHDAITTEASGQQACQALLARAEPVDAICAASDLIAIGAIRALRDAGLRVPQDVAVTGFDDIPLAASVSPALTTVQQDTKQAGQLLVERLLALIGQAAGGQPEHSGEAGGTRIVPARVSAVPANARRRDSPHDQRRMRTGAIARITRRQRPGKGVRRMLKIDSLSKTYANGVHALNNVSLDIPRGMFGLLGPNGAGKSSLMRTLSTLQEADSGTAVLSIPGEAPIDVLRDKDAVRRRLGYLPQDFGVYPKVSALDLLEHFAVLKGLTQRAQRREVVDGLLQQVNLWDARKRKLGTYSGGMRQRFGIAQALLGDPRLVIVDEPTAGLDPEERNRFLNLLAAIGENVAVILSTHIVEDVTDLCPTMAIMNKGQVLLSGRPSEAIDALQHQVWRKQVDPSELAEHEARHVVLSTRLVGGRPVIHVHSANDPGDGFAAVAPDLEDVYFQRLRLQARARAAA